jgi:hypothetical protein
MKLFKEEKIKFYLSIVALLVSMLIIFIYLEKIENHFFLWDDNADYFVVNYDYNWRALVENKTIPFINFHQYSGQTYLGQGQTGFFYFPVYIASFISKIIFGNSLWTIDLLVLLHFILASLGCFLLFREYKISFLRSILGSVFFVTLPFFVLTAKSWIIISYFIGLLPFNFLYFIRLIKNASKKNVFILAIIKSLFVFQGNFQFMAFLIPLEIIYIISEFTFPFINKSAEKTIDWRVAKRYTLSLLLFIVITLPVIIEVFIAQQYSANRSLIMPLEQFLNNKIVLSELLLTQLLVFKKNAIFGAGSQIFYIGIPILSFGLYFLVDRYLFIKNNKNGIVSFILCGTLSLIFSTCLYSLLYSLPLYNHFRWPFKYFLFFVFFWLLCVMILSGVSRKKSRSLSIFLFISICVNLSVIYSTHNFGKFNSFRIDDDYNNTNFVQLSKYLSAKDGKIITMWLDGDNKKGKMYQYSSFTYSTLLNNLNMGGYDALVSYLNFQKALGLDYQNIYSGPMDQSTLDYLSNWSVKYFITEKDNEKKIIDNYSQLAKTYEAEDLVVFENTKALPIAYYEETKEAVPISFGINGFEANISPGGKNRNLIINLVNLPWYYYSLNNGKYSKIEKNLDYLRIPVASDSINIKVKYINLPFLISSMISLSFFIFFMIILLFRNIIFVCQGRYGLKKAKCKLLWKK